MRLPLLALGLIAAAGPALAQTAAPTPVPSQPITRAEAQARLAEMFKRNDTNGDGVVTLAEQSAKLDEMIAKRPANVPAPTAEQLATIRKNAAAAFAKTDMNGDGKITPVEASRQPLAMFDRADTNKDGVLSPEEQAAGIRAMQAARGN